MNPPATAREALLIEALGEMGDVLDRVEALMPAMEAGRRSLAEAHEMLSAQLSSLEVRMVASVEAAKNGAVDHISERTRQAARHSIELHLKIMEEAARALFLKELAPALRGLVQPLLHVREVLRNSARPWDTWLTHAATAAVASLFTWLLASGAWRP